MNLRRQPQEESKIEALFQQLDDRDSARREAAKQTLDQLGADSTDRMADLLAREARKYRKLRFVCRSIYIGCCAIAVLSLLIWGRAGFDHLRRLSTGNSLLDLTILIPFFAFLVLRSRKYAVYALAERNDVRAIGSLIEALSIYDARDVARHALIRLLPRLKASDSSLLSARNRADLYRNLNSTNTEFVIAIIKAMEQVGDASTLPHIQRLARSAKSEAVRQAAQECLPYLEARIEAVRSSDMLLRASGSSDSSEASLLRPVGNTSGTDQNQLLRAVRPEGKYPSSTTATQTESDEAIIRKQTL